MSTPSKNSKQTSWSTRRLIAWTSKYLQEHQIDAPKLSAELLLAHVLGIPRIELYMDLDRPASPKERSAFKALVEKAVAHYPIQYLTNHAHFYSMSLYVDEHTLVPRDCTEVLVEYVIHHVRATPGFAEPLIADIGTGSGCIAIALAKNIPGARVIATDTSAGALAVAQKNAEAMGVSDRIEFRQGSLYEPFGNERFAFVISNPPYIPDHEWDAIAPNVKDHEPTSALRGGADGLDLLRIVIDKASDYLVDGGQLVCEIAACQNEQVLGLCCNHRDLIQEQVLADLDALPRILVANRTHRGPEISV